MWKEVETSARSYVLRKILSIDVVLWTKIPFGWVAGSAIFPKTIPVQASWPVSFCAGSLAPNEVNYKTTTKEGSMEEEER